MKDIEGKEIKDARLWDRLSKEEKDEIKKKAAEKRRAKEQEILKKYGEILSGKQKTIDDSWENE